MGVMMLGGERGSDVLCGFMLAYGVFIRLTSSMKQCHFKVVCRVEPGHGLV